MTRIGPQHVVSRVADLIVISDAGQGTEVSMQMQDAARLVTALPYLLTGSTAVQEIAAERLRHLRTHSRSQDLAGGPVHLGEMLLAASRYLALAAAQCAALTSEDATRLVHEHVLNGTVGPGEGWPEEGWTWTPREHPSQNIVLAAALGAAAVDALNTLTAIGQSMPRTP